MSEKDWSLRAAESIYATFKNASYFSTRNAEHKRQMLEGWAELIRREQAIAAGEWAEVLEKFEAVSAAKPVAPLPPRKEKV